MAKYRWSRDLVVMVLQDIIRRTRENGRRQINRDLASRGLPRPRGRPPKNRVSKLLADVHDVTIPMAPLPDTSSSGSAPPQTTKRDKQAVQQNPPSLVKGSIAKRQEDYPSIDANVVPHQLKHKGKAVVPANKRSTIVSRSKWAQRH
jgi:hypothetical protein